MLNLDPALISSVVKSFYDLATSDILIGFHFKKIHNFEEHLPRINTFWEFQLNGRTTIELDRPFDLFNVHLALKMTVGQLNRWVLLFESVLDQYVAQGKLSGEQKEEWMQKVHFFKERLMNVTV